MHNYFCLDWRKREVLKWPQRMSITMGVARGVQYLHTGGVLGNDIKIDNILLDESLTAKISSYNINIPSKVKSIHLQELTWILDKCVPWWSQVGAESPLHGQDASNQSHGYISNSSPLHIWLIQHCLCHWNSIHNAAKIQKRKTFIGWELF